MMMKMKNTSHRYDIYSLDLDMDRNTEVSSVSE